MSEHKRDWHDDDGPTTISVGRQGEKWYVWNDATGTQITYGFSHRQDATEEMDRIANGGSIHDTPRP